MAVQGATPGAPPWCYTAQNRTFEKHLILKDFCADEIGGGEGGDSNPRYGSTVYLGYFHDLPLHIKQPPHSIALKDLNLAPIQQGKFGRQFELDSMLGAFFTQSWLDGSSPGDDFVSIALPQRPACLILSPTAKWRHCSRKAVKSLFVQAGKNSSKTRRGKSE